MAHRPRPSGAAARPTRPVVGGRHADFGPAAADALLVLTSRYGRATRARHRSGFYQPVALHQLRRPASPRSTRTNVGHHHAPGLEADPTARGRPALPVDFPHNPACSGTQFREASSKILPAFDLPLFMDAFHDKPPMTNLVERMPVAIVLNRQTGLLGAAVYAATLGS
jgi:hypothetical protein